MFVVGRGWEHVGAGFGWLDRMHRIIACSHCMRPPILRTGLCCRFWQTSYQPTSESLCSFPFLLPASPIPSLPFVFFFSLSLSFPAIQSVWLSGCTPLDSFGTRTRFEALRDVKRHVVVETNGIVRRSSWAQPPSLKAPGWRGPLDRWVLGKKC